MCCSISEIPSLHITLIADTCIINTPPSMANLCNKKPERSLRIIGGKFRHRQIKFYPYSGLRPTANRTRESLFNWLQGDINGASVLDLFSGSGALGFEALSRGAREVVMVENQWAVYKCLNSNIQALNAPAIRVINEDAISYLGGGEIQKFDIIFLDPPFNQGLIGKCCQLIHQHGWINPNSLIYLEAERQLDPLPIPNSWKILRSNSTNEVGYYLTQPQT